MAIYHEDIISIELNSGNIHRSFARHSIGSGDSAANRFGIRVLRGGEEVDLTGCSCYGYFRDPRGNNIALTSNGTVDGAVAYVTLPQACYNYEGQFCLSIKLIGGGVTGTMRIVDGVVDNTNTGSAVAPTSTVPTYSEILSQYDAMVAATAAANGCIAETFDATKAYSAGQYVINSGSLYRLTDDHAANVTWANTSKVEVKFGNELSDVKSALRFKVNIPVDEHNQPTNGTNGQLLRTKGDGKTEWVNFGLPTDAQTAEAVTAWLNEHPEATTTVQDGSLTEAKFSNALKIKALKDYVTPEMFGAVGDGTTDDTIALQNAFDAGKPVFAEGGKVYRTTDSITITEFSFIDFGRSTIKADHADETLIIANTRDVNYGVLSNITIDCNDKSSCGLCSQHGKRNLYLNIFIKNCTGMGAYFEASNGCMVRNMYLHGGITENHLNNTAIVVHSADMTFDSVDFACFMHGMKFEYGGAICSKIHGFITGTNQIAHYYESSFMEFATGARFTISDSYPDTQKYFFKITAENVYLDVHGGYSFVAAVITGDTSGYIDRALMNDHGPIYVFYAANKEYLKNVSFSNFTVSCRNIATAYPFSCYLSNFADTISDNLINMDDSVQFEQGGVLLTMQNKEASDKNILYYNWKTKTQDGITVTNTDGVLTLSGTCSGDPYTDIFLCRINAKNGLQYISNGIPGGSGSSYQIICVDATAFPIGQTLNCSSVTDSIATAQGSKICNLYLRVYKNWSGTAKLYPMVRLSGGNTFQPGINDKEFYYYKTKSNTYTAEIYQRGRIVTVSLYLLKMPGAQGSLVDFDLSELDIVPKYEVDFIAVPTSGASTPIRCWLRTAGTVGYIGATASADYACSFTFAAKDDN